MVTDIVRIREAEVYRTAAFLFNKRGYSSTSIRQICRTIGIRESSLYHYIRSKEDLLLNICERAMKKGLEVIEPIAKADLRPDQKLKKMVDTHMAMLARNSNEHYSMIKEIRSLSPARRLKVTHLRDRYETLFRKMIEECVRERFFRSVDIKMTTFALLGMMNSSIRWYSPDGPVGSGKIAKIFWEIFFKGVRN